MFDTAEYTLMTQFNVTVDRLGTSAHGMYLVLIIYI